MTIAELIDHIWIQRNHAYLMKKATALYVMIAGLDIDGSIQLWSMNNAPRKEPRSWESLVVGGSL
jgi:hypothetical protein